jgi:hypothetical protein
MFYLTASAAFTNPTPEVILRIREAMSKEPVLMKLVPAKEMPEMIVRMPRIVVLIVPIVYPKYKGKSST